MLVMESCEQSVRRHLNADPAEVRLWERDAFDRISEGRPLILCGAGGLGRKTLLGLRGVATEPLAFVDSNPVLWGKTVDGLRVLDPVAASHRLRQRLAELAGFPLQSRAA